MDLEWVLYRGHQARFTEFIFNAHMKPLWEFTPLYASLSEEELIRSCSESWSTSIFEERRFQMEFKDDQILSTDPDVMSRTYLLTRDQRLALLTPEERKKWEIKK